MGILLALKFVRRLVTALVLFVFVSIAATAAYVLFHALREDRTPTDAIVVLGAAQFDGEPSPVLRNRLDRAVALYEAGVAGRIVTVGGNQPGDRFTEATAGKNYLHAQGVPYAHITPIKEGSDTFTSIAAVNVWATKAGIASFTVVSDRCHVGRAAAMLRSYGYAAHAAAPAQGPGSAITWTYLARETGGLLRFWLFDDADFALPVGA